MRKYFLFIRLALLFIIPIVLLILPSSYFDEGQSLCLSILLLDKECFACGMTRAIMHLIHFDFSMALYYNVLSFAVFPILAFVWFTWMRNDINKWKDLA